MRIIGDVHGKMDRYIEIAKCSPDGESVQVGDVGFAKDYVRLKELDPRYHTIIAGNHDDYTLHEAFPIFKHQTAHFPGEYGLLSGTSKTFFFVRGGRSIDKHLRTPGLNWWADEELSVRSMRAALEQYKRVKPQLVITHECPSSIVDMIHGPSEIGPSATALLLQAMFEAHQPKEWFFGHHHVTWQDRVNGCNFRCLNELEFVDI